MINITIKWSGDKRVNLEVDETTATVLEVKEKIAKEIEDTPPSSQRLIFAGRILKDTEKLSEHKVVDGNTIHMVKSSAKKQSAAAAAGGGASLAGAAIRDDSITTSIQAAEPSAANVQAPPSAGATNPWGGDMGDMASMFGMGGMGGMDGMMGGMGGDMPQMTPEMMEQMYSNPM
ncbi:hypothetical protein EV175_006956, partial [Coemansia sp. RSA 1933]